MWFGFNHSTKYLSGVAVLLPRYYRGGYYGFWKIFQVVADIAKQPMDIEEVMKALDIDKYKNRFPKELSGGQQQRVAIARALIKNPKILLCDELTGALDSRSSRSVLKFIEKVNEQFKTTIIIITHNEAIADMADTVIRIKDGQVASCIDNNSKHSAEELEL